MLEQTDGWFIRNIRDAMWVESATFGKACAFDVGQRFAQTGIHVFVLEPGKPNCRYHREDAQEDFLVLAGQCTLLVNDEEHALEAWDFVHCPPGVSHVLVGAGDGPSAVLAIGHRPGEGKERIFYPASELARRYNAESPEPTPDPGVAYSDAAQRQPIEAPEWPVG